MTWFDGIRLVARREIVERMRTKTYLTSTAVLIAVALAAVLVPAVIGSTGPRTVKVGLVGERATALATPLSAAASSADLEVDTTHLPAANDARQAVENGQLDIAVVDGSGLIAKGSLDPVVGAFVNRVVAVAEIQSALQAGGMSGADAAQIANPPPLPVTLVAAADRGTDARKAAALGAILILDLGLVLYGTSIATGVVEEKSTHVVETLLAALRPRQLLAGKIIGIGAVGLTQLAVVVAVGGTGALIAGQARIPQEALSAIPWLVLWVILGYAFYSALFAAVGALVSRQEELAAAITPLTILIVLTYVVGNAATGSPSSPAFRILSLFPPFSPMLMPVRGTLGVVTWWEAIIAVGLILATTYGAVRGAARIYSRGLLSSAPLLSLRMALHREH